MADKQSTYVIDDNSNLIRSFEETTDNVADASNAITVAII